MAVQKPAKLKNLTAKAVKENTAALEDVFLNSDIDTSWIDTSYSPREAQLVDVAIATLAKYGNNVLLADVIEVEELDHGNNYDANLIHALTVIYAAWVDREAIINREDNALHEPQGEDRNWKNLMDHEIGKLLARKGTLMGHSRSIYTWTDFSVTGRDELPPIVAVFNVHEDYWYEFAGTFVTENDSKTGFTCNVMYADGEFRDLRYEGELGEIMREITPKKK